MRSDDPPEKPIPAEGPCHPLMHPVWRIARQSWLAFAATAIYLIVVILVAGLLSIPGVVYFEASGEKDSLGVAVVSTVGLSLAALIVTHGFCGTAKVSRLAKPGCRSRR